MAKKIVWSVRFDEDTYRMAEALGLNVSKICTEAVKRTIINLQPRRWNVVPPGVLGLSKNTRILMAETGKFRQVDRIRTGDRIVSYNIGTSQCEEANVIDVGPLTGSETFVSFIRITNNVGTTVELLPDTKLYCTPVLNSGRLWISAKDVREGYSISSQSGPYRNGMLMGSTTILEAEQDFSKSIFYKLEAYPNNIFFANSNRERKLSWPSIGAAWGFPIRGFPGQIGALLDQDFEVVKDGT